MGSDATRVTYTGIVDERRFYSQATGTAHPLTAADYLDYPRMRAVLVALQQHARRRAVVAVGQLRPVGRRARRPAAARSCLPNVRRDYKGPHTVFFTNLGMLGMNVGLDVRVIDQIGLANPLAAHTARLTDGRIGHDKNLFPDWAVAEGPFLKIPPFIPPTSTRTGWRRREVALKCPGTEAMLSVGPRSAGCAAILVKPGARTRVHAAIESTGCRSTSSVRCGLEAPTPTVPPYTGMPATGP